MPKQQDRSQQRQDKKGNKAQPVPTEYPPPADELARTVSDDGALIRLWMECAKAEAAKDPQEASDTTTLKRYAAIAEHLKKRPLHPTAKR